MSDLTTWIVAHGIPADTLIYLLYVPIIATIINISRYVIGFKTYGIYAPLTLSFAFYYAGIRFGLLLTVGVILATLLAYRVLSKIRMHYVSRISVTYIFIIIFVIFLITANEVSPISITTSNHNPNAIHPLAIIVIATLSDYFIKKYVRRSMYTAALSMFETIIVALIGWSFIKYQPMHDFLFTNAWIIFLLIPLNIWLGQYSGLRLREYLRFRHIAKHT